MKRICKKDIAFVFSVLVVLLALFFALKELNIYQSATRNHHIKNTAEQLVDNINQNNVSGIEDMLSEKLYTDSGSKAYILDLIDYFEDEVVITDMRCDPVYTNESVGIKVTDCSAHILVVVECGDRQGIIEIRECIVHNGETDGERIGVKYLGIIFDGKMCHIGELKDTITLYDRASYSVKGHY